MEFPRGTRSPGRRLARTTRSVREESTSGGRTPGTASTSLIHSASGRNALTQWNIYYGGHEYEYAPVVLSRFYLTGRETLVGMFSRYALDRTWVGDSSEFTIDLSTMALSEPSIVGDPSNRIGYTFSRGFPGEAQEQYREFLRRVTPILYEYLGPPAESFDVLITNTGEEDGPFRTAGEGRVLVTDASFLPRLIVHELVHAWEGSYGINSDGNWQYDDSLSGFAEGLADGMAYEIIHEYVRSYPDDAATLSRSSVTGSYEYWSSSDHSLRCGKECLRWTGRQGTSGIRTAAE